MTKGILPWYMGGALLAIAFLSAVILIKPIGVSTQFVIADGIVWDLINPDIIVEDEAADKGYSSPNAYLNKSGGKYAASVADPINYSFIFVIAMVAGTFLSVIFKGDAPTSAEEKAMPEVWRNRFGDNKIKRYVWSFIAGFLVLLGARIAGGCTSGHMMSGMMQTAVSGYLFSLGVFITAVPLAIILFKEKK